ncbi:MAG: MFS transporter, partial [Spirochaetales bacterium]|nr:MFS transporter [Spirochaetales bacterium]
MTALERRILFFSSVAHFLTHFYILVFPALVMPISRDLGMPVSSVLNISFWMYLLYGLLALGWGWLSDHAGHRWAMASGMIIAGLGFVSAGLVRSPGLITVSFALVGVGCSAYHPSGLALVSQGVRERGRALGINGIWGNIGIASVPFVVGALNYLMGWQRGVLLLGAVGVAVGLASLAVPFSVDRGRDLKSVEKLDDRLAVRLFIVFCFAAMFAGFMYRTFTLILPALLEARLGNLAAAFRQVVLSRAGTLRDTAAFDTLVANLIATGVYLLGIVGQAVGGRVADRYSLKWAYFAFFCLALPFVLAMTALRSLWLVPAAGMFVLFSMGMQPIENSLVAYLTPARWRSVGYGVKFTLTFGAGSFAVKLAGLVE